MLSQSTTVWLILHSSLFLQKIRADFSQKSGQKSRHSEQFLWFCRLSIDFAHFRALFCCLTNNSITPRTCTEFQKFGQNHNNPSVIRAIFPKCPDIRARPDLSGRLGRTALAFSIVPAIWKWDHLCAMNYSSLALLLSLELRVCTSVFSHQPHVGRSLWISPWQYVHLLF